MLSFKINLQLKMTLTIKLTTEASEAVFINQRVTGYSIHFCIQSIQLNHVIDARTFSFNLISIELLTFHSLRNLTQSGFRCLLIFSPAEFNFTIEADAEERKSRFSTRVLFQGSPQGTLELFRQSRLKCVDVKFRLAVPLSLLL